MQYKNKIKCQLQRLWQKQQKCMCVKMHNFPLANAVLLQKQYHIKHAVLAVYN